MLKMRQRPTTPTIDPVALTEEINDIDRRMPEIDTTIALVRPERGIASGLGDVSRLSFVEQRIAGLEAERSTLAKRRDAIIATLRTARDGELTAWQRERWQPAGVVIQRERQARAARCRELAAELVAALEDVKQHPFEVGQHLDQLEAERWEIIGRYAAVPGSVDRPARPAEIELAYGDWKTLMRDLDATLNPKRTGIPLVVG